MADRWSKFEKRVIVVPIRLLARPSPGTLVALSVVVYFAAVPVLAGAGDGYFTIMSLVPVITASLQLGQKHGLLMALILTPVNLALVQVIEGSLASMMAPGGMLGSVSLFGTAWLVGYLHELAQRSLVRVVEEKDRLIGTISHELRTPLSTVVGLSHELTDHLDDFTRDEVIEFTGMIAQQSSELEALIEDLLVAARADIERIRILDVPVDLSEVVGGVVDAVSSSWDSARPDVVVEGEGVARGDGLRVRQIVRNLLQNARRYGGEAVRVEVHDRGERCVVVVADDGPGISDDKVASIFKPHVRAHDANGNAESLGLGLYVSRTLASLMQGSLTYERRRGETRFILDLPRYRTP